MNLFDFWGLMFGGTTKDSYDKKNGEQKLWPSVLLIVLAMSGIFILHLLLSVLWK